jgi:hypothetical protein
VSLLEEHDTVAAESAGRVEDRMGY